MPTIARVHPTALRFSLLSFPLTSKPNPAPSIPRVLAISPISAKVNSIVFILYPISKLGQLPDIRNQALKLKNVTKPPEFDGNHW
jgi:hypothetical protein